MDKTFIDNNVRQKKVNTNYHNLRHNLRAKKTFFKKIHPRGKSCKYYTSRVLYIPFYPPKSPTFGTKPLPRRRFLQHYYRDTFIESHRKAHRCPIDVPQMSYGGHLIKRYTKGIQNAGVLFPLYPPCTIRHLIR